VRFVFSRDGQAIGFNRSKHIHFVQGLLNFRAVFFVKIFLVVAEIVFEVLPCLEDVNVLNPFLVLKSDDQFFFEFQHAEQFKQLVEGVLVAAVEVQDGYDGQFVLDLEVHVLDDEGVPLEHEAVELAVALEVVA